MIPNNPASFDEIIRMSQQACDALSDEDDGLKREILAHAGSRWSLGVVHALATAGTLRHAVLARQLEGVSQRMLTRTLRHLERDGLIARHDYAELPPRVEYRLTDLGRSFLASMIPLWAWIMDYSQAFRDARQEFDSPVVRDVLERGSVVRHLLRSDRRDHLPIPEPEPIIARSDSC